MPHREGFKKVLLQYYNENSPLTGIEIGCFKGEFARYLLENFGNLKLTSIDPFCYWDEIIGNIGPNIHRFRLLNLYSDEAIHVINCKCDFVFIDGDHSYEQCRKDILNYSAIVKNGGIVSGHNYDRENYHPEDEAGGAHPGVNKAVDGIYPNVKLAPDFIWYIQKE